MVSPLKFILPVVGLVGLVTWGSYYFLLNRDDCMIPKYSDWSPKAYHTTYVAKNKEDYVNGDYRLGQFKSNLTNMTHRSEGDTNSENLPPYFPMFTIYYDRNEDDLPDLIVEMGKPRNKEESTVEFDEDFDGVFDKRVTFRGKLAKECFIETADSNPEIPMYKATRTFSK